MQYNLYINLYINLDYRVILIRSYHRLHNIRA